MKLFWNLVLFSLIASILAFPAPGKVIVETLSIKALEGNLLGDPTIRSVTVYLPPSYDQASEKRYPAVYLLHGVGDTDARWRGNPRKWFNVESILDEGVSRGTLGEMIVVMPSCRTKFLGGLYSNSPVHGGLETYITVELIAAIDSSYRTLPHRDSRGLAGHSMGGYGALRYAMRHPDKYCAIYAMNAAALGWSGDFSQDNLAFHWAASIRNERELLQSHFWTIALLSAAHAFSPAVEDPPFFAHLPFHWDRTKPHLVPQEPYYSMWCANLPLFMVEEPTAQRNLRSLKGLRFDSAFSDEFSHIPPTNRAFSQRLTELGIEHTFEMYNGDHRNRISGEGGRLHTEVFPFFSRILNATPPP